MKITLFLILLFSSLIVQSQTTIEYDNVYNGLTSSSESVIISIYSYQLKKASRPYYIELKTDSNWTPPIYNNEKEQITFDISTTQEQRIKVLEFFKTNSYFDSLYLHINHEYYGNITEAKDTFLIEQPVLLIEFFFPADKRGNRQDYMQVYIPIFETENAQKLLVELSLLFEQRDKIYFKKLMKEIVKNI